VRRPDWIDGPPTKSELNCRSKVRFRSINGARTSASKIRMAGGIKLWPYECRHCKGWHLTSLTPDQQNRGE
jgi:hypothetical protein